MSPEEKDACVETLAKMTIVVDYYYAAAQRIGVHRFLEFAGLMREYLLMLGDQVEQGINIIEEQRPDPKPHQMAYVAEKIDCIYGRHSAEAKDAFVAELRRLGWAIP